MADSELQIEYWCDGERRRTRFVRRDGEIHRVEQFYNGCKFVTRGSELVDDVHIEGALPGAAVLEEVQ